MTKYLYKLPHYRRRRTFLEWSLIFVGTSVLLLFVVIVGAFILRQKQVVQNRIETGSWLPSRINTEIVDNAHLFENTCRFLWVEEEEPSLELYIQHPRDHGCEPPAVRFFTRNADGSFVRHVDTNSTTCIAAEIVGALRNKRWAVESSRRAEIKMKHFYVNADVFRISCFDANGQGVLANVFAGLHNISINELIVEGAPTKPPPVGFNIKNMSISILGFDSTSRAQFFRHMKKTLAEMKAMGFITFHGYNKIGDNTLVNFLPILAPQVDEGLKFPKLDEFGDINILRFHPSRATIDPDTIKFIWKDMKKKGCITMYSDDIMNSAQGLFHSGRINFKQGFLQQPTDHYYRAYFTRVYEDMRNLVRNCYQGDFLHTKFLEIWYRFLMAHSNTCSFSFSFLVSLTHDHPNEIELLDDLLSEQLRDLKESNALQNTMLIIMGDHGNRVTRMSRTFAGKIEERQPLLSVFLPKSFVQSYPENWQNFRVNTQRFISNFDLHETLLDIIGGKIGEKRTGKRGVSLFREIPTNRSCIDNNVVHNFCLCMEPEPKKSRSEIDRSTMLRSLKRYLRRHRCVKRSSVQCHEEVDMRVPNEMVRLRMRNKQEVPKHEIPGKPSDFVYLYQNCTAKSKQGDLLDITVQYRFDRESSYDIVYPPMVVPQGNDTCASVRNVAAYCKCSSKGNSK